jgi:hypothetical protein
LTPRWEKLVANNRYANAARRKRQEGKRKRKLISRPHAPPAPSHLDELAENLNYVLSAVRKAAESPRGRAILDRILRLLESGWILDGVTSDSEGWAALLNLANGRSFSAMKNRRQIAAHKPGQTLMFSAADVLRASVRSQETPRPPKLDDQPTS